MARHMSKAEAAEVRKKIFQRFSEGLTPKEVALRFGISTNNAHNYHADWKKLSKKSDAN